MPDDILHFRDVIKQIIAFSRQKYHELEENNMEYQVLKMEIVPLAVATYVPGGSGSTVPSNPQSATQH